MNDSSTAPVSTSRAASEPTRPRVTVSAVCRRDDSFLMVRERVGGKTVLNLPGGHLDPGETLVQAAQREALEESGWKVDIDALVGIYQWHAQHRNRRYVRFVFSARALQRIHETPPEPGILDVHWLPMAALQEEPDQLRSPVILDILNDFEQGQRFPLTLLGAADSL